MRRLESGGRSNAQEKQKRDQAELKAAAAKGECEWCEGKRVRGQARAQVRVQARREVRRRWGKCHATTQAYIRPHMRANPRPRSRVWATRAFRFWTLRHPSSADASVWQGPDERRRHQEVSPSGGRAS